MADVTKTVLKSGGDYSTVQSAVDACSTFIEAGSWYKVEIGDAAEYSERVTLTSGEVTSPSITHYLWLTAASGVRHSGVAGTGHARIKNGWEAVLVHEDFSRVDWLQLQSTSANRSTIGVRQNASGVLISHCVIWKDTATHHAVDFDQQGGYGSDCSIDNCVIYAADGAGIAVQMTWGNSTQEEINIDHCTILSNGQSSGADHAGAIVANMTDTDGNFIINAYNNIAAASANETDWANNNGATRGTIVSGATLVWNGSHNVHTTALSDMGGTGVTDNITNWLDATGGLTTTTTTSDAIIVTNATEGTEDFTLLEATGGGSNQALATGTDRIGSEPDSRQDFSIDVAGNTRPTTNVDVGAFQISAAGGGAQEITGATTATIGVTFPAGSLTPGTAAVTGATTATIGVTFPAGTLSPAAAAVTGATTATIGVTYPTGTLTPGVAALTGATTATIGVTFPAGSLTPGTAAVLGATTATMGVTFPAGTLATGAATQEIDGATTATIGVTFPAGSLTPGTAAVVGATTATFGVTFPTGTLTPGTAAVTGATTATIGVTFPTGTLTAGTAAITGATTATFGVTYPTGTLTPGTGTITGATTATMGVTFPAGTLASGQSIAGATTATIGVTFPTGTLTPGTAELAGATTATIGVTFPTGTVTPGTAALVGATTATIGVTFPTGTLEIGAQEVTGATTATIGVTFPTGTLTPGTGVITGGTTATIGVTFPAGTLSAGVETIRVYIPPTTSERPHPRLGNEVASGWGHRVPAIPKGSNVVSTDGVTFTVSSITNPATLDAAAFVALGGHQTPVTAAQEAAIIASGVGGTFATVDA